jgi:predicted AlkP superfamily pyrophosphatase or phosphodiesterase
MNKSPLTQYLMTRLKKQSRAFATDVARTSTRLLIGAAALAAFGLTLSCSSVDKHASAPVVAPTSAMLAFAPEARNSAEVMQKPYVVLVSLDGYRWDYNKKFAPPNLNALAGAGVQADALIPVYPSKTFPNHFSIITGLTADKHGIVSNEFYDPSRDAGFSLSDRKAVQDGSWCSCEPLWTAVEKQGGVTATYFFPGSEADIGGYHPNYYFNYDESTPNETRVKQALSWLSLPEDRRPHFIAMYMSDVDTANHQYGPDASQTRDAVMAVDRMIGQLREGIEKTGLPVNLIVVSDHGVEKLDDKKKIILDDFADLSKFRVAGRGPQMLLYLNKGEDPKIIDETAKKLKAARGPSAKHFRVFRRSELKPFRYDQSPRVGDLVIEVDPPWSVGTKEKPPYTTGGNHGWDPRKSKNMNGVFFAAGPDFKEKFRMKAFDNVNIYPLVLEVLGMKPLRPIDGKLTNVQTALRR